MATDPTLKVRLGLVVRRRRERLGITQEEFADSLGLTTSYYGKIERGLQNITLGNLQRVADGLRVAVSSLIKDAEGLDWDKALLTPHRPPRVGRPKGRR